MDNTLKNFNYTNYDNFLLELKKYYSEDYLNFNKKIYNYDGPMLGVSKKNLELFIRYFKQNKIKKEDFISCFLKRDIKSFEEKILFVNLFSSEKIDDEERKKYIEIIIKEIDNWAICDGSVSAMKFFKKRKNELYDYIISKLKSDNFWEQRFAIVTLLSYYIEENFLDKIFNLISSIETDEYYVKMAIAWLISVAFVKHSEKTYYFLKNTKIDSFTFNTAIQKIKESKRVEDSYKEKNIELKNTFRKEKNVR